MIKSYLKEKKFYKPVKSFSFKNIFYISVLLLFTIFAITQLVLPIYQKSTKKPVKNLPGKILGQTSFLPSVQNAPILPKVIPETKKPQILAQSYILIDADTFYPILEKNSRQILPIASLTKIMTATISLENYKLSDEVIVSQNAVSTIGSDIQLRTGEKITVESLLYALLINSANDAGVALAEQIGSLDKFVSMMNEKAKVLGLKDTYFKDPVGLSTENHSTAFDLAVLFSYALQNQTFLKIIQIPEYTITSVDGTISHQLKNSNRLILKDEKYYLNEVIGGKTGFTPEAGHCLVAVAKKDSHPLISVILDTSENTVTASAAETKKLLQWAFENVTW